MPSSSFPPYLVSCLPVLPGGVGNVLPLILPSCTGEVTSIYHDPSSTGNLIYALIVMERITHQIRAAKWQVKLTLFSVSLPGHVLLDQAPTASSLEFTWLMKAPLNKIHPQGYMLSISAWHFLCSVVSLSSPYLSPAVIFCYITCIFYLLWKIPPNRF